MPTAERKKAFKAPEARRDRRVTDVHVPATITDGMAVTLPCVVRDFSRSGCRVHGAGVEHIAPDIELSIDGLGAKISGNVAWRIPGVVGIVFAWEVSEQDADEPPPHLRKEKRKRVQIRAMVFTRDNLRGAPCLIFNISKNGCGIKSPYIAVLPDEIRLSVKELDLSVAGKIRWRRGHRAGVELDWTTATKLSA